MNVYFSEDTEKTYKRLKRFLSQTHETGYCFATATDQRLISLLSKRLEEEIPSIKRLFFSENDKPYIQQIIEATENHSAVLVMDVSEVLQKHNSFINTLNFARETLIGLGKPIVFWLTDNGLKKIANQASDLYSQRHFTTIRFEEILPVELLNKSNDAVFEKLEDQDERKIRYTAIKVLEHQLTETKNLNQNTAKSIILPLAKHYAEDGKRQEALSLVQKYDKQINHKNDDQLFELAEIYSLCFDYDEALQNYERALHYTKSKKLQAICYERLGTIHTETGNLIKALEYFEGYSKLGQELYSSYPNNVSFKNGLAISYSKLGDTHSSLGNVSKALEYFENDIKLSQELYTSYPNNVSFKSDLAISYEKLGKTHSSLGNLSKALEYFEIETKLFEELYTSYPTNVRFKNCLAISYSKLGETHASLGNLSKALEYFENDIKLSQELYTSNPNNVSFKNDLAISYSKLGDTYASLGNLIKALEYFEIETKLFEELYTSYPTNVRFKNCLAVSYFKLGETYRDTHKKSEALSYFLKTEKLLEELVNTAPQAIEYRDNLKEVQETITALEKV